MEKLKVKVKNGSRIEHLDRVGCSRKERKERKDCGRVDVGDVLTQRRRDAEYAERYEPRNTLNTRNANTT